MNVILFGGSFDPPHLGHQTVAHTVLLTGIADAVWLVPCGQHPFRKAMSKASDRLAMLELVAGEGMTVCSEEVDRPEVSYSYETLRRLSARHPEHRFGWVMGSEQLPSFHTWHRYEDLLREFPVYVYPRRDAPFEPLYPGMTALSQMAEVDISSTAIRLAVAEGRPIGGMVLPPVERYIRERQLYVPAHAPLA